MLGAIIGDIIGSPYEFDNTSNPNFPLFRRDSIYTDDSICTIAVADAILRKSSFKESLRHWCLRYPYPMGGYGSMFRRWLYSSHPTPYNSWGNGSAMRVSAVGWAFDSEAETLRAALASAAPTHNHVEGLIGAAVVACAIYRLRTSEQPSFQSEAISSLICSYYGPDWEKHLPAQGVFDGSCQGCVPLAFHLLLETERTETANFFESAIRRTILYGGDTDTTGAIVGALAEARWGIPSTILSTALKLLPQEMIDVLNAFKKAFNYPPTLPR